MESSLNRVNKSCSSFHGNFYLYRYSVIPNRIVKTKLRIYPASDVEKMWMFDQEYVDQLGMKRISSGAVLSLMGNIYCLGKIASGFGLEVISFREPVSAFQPLTQALLLSIDTRNQPIAARSVLRHSKSCPNEKCGNFDYADIRPEIEDFVEWLKGSSVSDRALTLSLL